MNETPVLQVKDLGIDFGGLTAVNRFNITVKKHQIVGLIGPNGAGKTTVFNMLTKVYDPSRGTIELNGHQINKLSTDGVGSFQTGQIRIPWIVTFGDLCPRYSFIES